MSDQLKYKNSYEENREEEMNIDFYRIYLEEMASIPPCTKEEQQALLEALASGDASAKKRLAEGTLALAVKTAEEFRDRGLSMADLVQEANMALLLFLEEIAGNPQGGPDGDFSASVRRRIREALEDAAAEQETEQKIQEEMAARVNVLKDISAGMAKELGREATVAELAERMRMTEEEIRDIMKLTLDAMSVAGDYSALDEEGLE